MKKLLTLATFAIGLNVFSQNITARKAEPLIFPNAIERYNIDYKLKDYTFQDGDSSVLLLLDLNYLETYRSPDSNIEVADPNTGLIVILFNRKRSRTTILQDEDKL